MICVKCKECWIETGGKKISGEDCSTAYDGVEDVKYGVCEECSDDSGE